MNNTKLFIRVSCLNVGFVRKADFARIGTNGHLG